VSRCRWVREKGLAIVDDIILKIAILLAAKELSIAPPSMPMSLLLPDGSIEERMVEARNVEDFYTRLVVKAVELFPHAHKVRARGEMARDLMHRIEYLETVERRHNELVGVVKEAMEFNRIPPRIVTRLKALLEEK